MRKPAEHLVIITKHRIMKKSFAVAALLIVSFAGMGQQKPQTDFTKRDPSKKIQQAEVSCGECQFKMKGKGCHLAVRIDGKSFWVSNADVDAFGDAHDKKMGFCNKIRKADVQGEVKNNRYVLSYLAFTDQ